MKAKDVRNGIVLDVCGEILQIISFENNGTMIKIDFVNRRNNEKITKTFGLEEDLKQIRLEEREVVFDFVDGCMYYFMDFNTYDTIMVEEEQLGEGFEFVKEGDECILLYAGNKLVRAIPPRRVTLEIISLSDSKDSLMKKAKVETGATIDVPNVCRIGDIVVIQPEGRICIGRQ